MENNLTSNGEKNIRSIAEFIIGLVSLVVTLIASLAKKDKGDA